MGCCLYVSRLNFDTTSEVGGLHTCKAIFYTEAHYIQEKMITHSEAHRNYFFITQLHQNFFLVMVYFLALSGTPWF